MNVFVVTEGYAYEGDEVVGVFRSKDDAIKKTRSLIGNDCETHRQFDNYELYRNGYHTIIIYKQLVK